MQSAPWELLLGPFGALVLALTLLWNLLRRSAAREESLLADLRQSRAQLEQEHAGRLSDAKATTATLLEVTDRIHQTLDSLDRLHRNHPP